MKHILRRAAPLFLPVLVWLAFFIAFEPNNYFGLKPATSSTQPVARVREYQADPGRNLILGDSRLAHIDMDQAARVSGRQWQNLAFGGASLKETLDLADYILDSGNPVDELVLSVSFYTLNQNYNTDRFQQLETTLENPVAYCLNLEYNVNALTVFLDTVCGTPDAVETGEWGPADYVGDDGETLPVHYKLYVYPQSLIPRCRDWSLSDQFDRIAQLAQRCRQQGVALTVVLPPMADNVLTEVCEPYGIDTAMEQQVLPQLKDWAGEYGFRLLDYEWEDRPDFDDDTQFYDGFHLDEVHGLPQWVEMLFSQLKQG